MILGISRFALEGELHDVQNPDRIGGRLGELYCIGAVVERRRCNADQAWNPVERSLGSCLVRYY